MIGELQAEILDYFVTKGFIELGRGNVISRNDIEHAPGDYPIYSSSTQNNGLFGKYAKYMFEEELVTWSVDGGGNFFYRPKHRYSVTNVTGYLRASKKHFNLKFLFYILDFQHRNLKFDYVEKAHPSVIRKLYHIPTVNLRTQQRIVDVLFSIDEAIAQTEALIAKYGRVRTGLMQDLLTKGIDEEGRIRSEETHAFKDSPLGRIPLEWDVKPANELCIAVIDCKNRTPPILEDGHPVIRTSNVRNGLFVRDGLLFTDGDSYEVWTKRGKPRPGDVLITREAPVGEICIIPDDLPRACLGQRMMMYQPNPEEMCNEFMLLALMSEQVQNSLIDLAGGSTVGHVRVGDIRTLQLPRPHLSEQKKIANVLGKVLEELNHLKHEAEKLRHIKTGLMQDLLTGRVSVDALLNEATSAMPEAVAT